MSAAVSAREPPLHHGEVLGVRRAARRGRHALRDEQLQQLLAVGRRRGPAWWRDGAGAGPGAPRSWWAARRAPPARRRRRPRGRGRRRPGLRTARVAPWADGRRLGAGARGTWRGGVGSATCARSMLLGSTWSTSSGPWALAVAEDVLDAATDVAERRRASPPRSSWSAPGAPARPSTRWPAPSASPTPAPCGSPTGSSRTASRAARARGGRARRPPGADGRGPPPGRPRPGRPRRRARRVARAARRGGARPARRARRQAAARPGGDAHAHARLPPLRRGRLRAPRALPGHPRRPLTD
jgi:hypothetical protein